MAPGARNKFGAPMLETEIFWKQMYCNEESTCEIAGSFRRPPQWFSAPIVTRRPGNWAPLASPRYALVHNDGKNTEVMNGLRSDNTWVNKMLFI